MADKGRHSSAKNTNSFGFCGNRQFCTCFVMCLAPAPKSIHRLHQEFQKEAMVLVTKCRRVKSVCTPRNIEAARTATQRSPGKINLEGHGRIKNIQMTSRANFAQWFARVSVQNDSGVWAHCLWCTTETGVYCVGTAWWSHNAHMVFREGTSSPRRHSKQAQCMLPKKMYHTQKITVQIAIYSHGLKFFK
jgi:hypothetical protein